MNPAARDYRLSSGSPCIDTGLANGLTEDLPGMPRPLDGDGNGSAVPDMGAYEFLLTTADSDQDGLSDGQELIADTDPTDTNSILAVTAIGVTNTGVWVQWMGGREARQYLEYCGDLISTGEQWQVLYTNEATTPIINVFVDTAVSNAVRIYRVRVAED